MTIGDNANFLVSKDSIYAWQYAYCYKLYQRIAVIDTSKEIKRKNN